TTCATSRTTPRSRRRCWRCPPSRARKRRKPARRRLPDSSGPGSGLAVGHDGEDVLLGHDQVLGLVELDLAPRVLGIDHAVPDLDVEGLALAGGLDEAPVADGLDQALLGLLLGRVGKDDAALGLLLPLDRLD